MRDNQNNGQNDSGQNGNIVARLFASFTDLEHAINSAKKTLAEKESIPEEIVKRLNSYDTILTKQRTLATSLCEEMARGNWDEVSRLVGLINGLSSMIRDDARAILSALALNSDNAPAEEEGVNFC